MDIIKIISIALSSLVIIVLLRKINNDYAQAASCLLSISICTFSMGILLPVFEFLKKLSFSSNYSSLFSLIFKSAGICILSSLAAEICRDCSEASLGNKIEFAGKCTMLALSLPVIKKVLENATSLLD